MTTLESFGKTELSNTALCATYEEALAEVAAAQAAADRILQQLYQRIEEEPGRLILPNDRYICEIQAPPTRYDDSRLVPLREIFTAEELRTCVTIVEKWNKTKALPLAKRYGDAALAIVEAAKEPVTSRGRIKFEKKGN